MLSRWVALRARNTVLALSTTSVVQEEGNEDGAMEQTEEVEFPPNANTETAFDQAAHNTWYYQAASNPPCSQMASGITTFVTHDASMSSCLPIPPQHIRELCIGWLQERSVEWFRQTRRHPAGPREALLEKAAAGNGVSGSPRSRLGVGVGRLCCS